MSANSPIDVNISAWNIDPAHTVAEFKLKHMMISNVKGQFAKVTGTLTVDESALENSHVEGRIDSSSLETRDAQRDAHLKSADFFGEVIDGRGGNNMADPQSEIHSRDSREPSGAKVDMKLEAIIIPVSDVDRSKAFYGRLGWRLDADFPFANGFRVVQFTPPGSGCSVQFGTKTTSAAPGSAHGLYLIVSNIAAAQGELVARGVEVSEVFHAGMPGAQFQPDRAAGRNSWILQEVTSRLPGRADPTLTTFASATDLASALRRASDAHGEHEKRIGNADPNWSDWYAEYMVRERAGKELPQ